MTRMTGPDCVVMCNLINTYIHITYWLYSGTDWCFEAFLSVKILGAGDDLLSSAAGKPRYVQLKRLR